MAKSHSLLQVLLATACASLALVSATPLPLDGERRVAAAGLPRGWPHHPAASEKAKVIYIMTNVNPNSVIAIPVNEDGSLSEQGSITPIDGAGGNEIDSVTNAPHAPDALGSQGSIELADNLIFALNAGTSTLSVLSIDKEDPLKLTLLGTPSYTNGDFPVSVAVSSDLKLACVANGGALAGVSCASYDIWKGLGPFDTLRPYAIHQSTPPVGPLNGPADILFNADETFLVGTVKSNGSTALPGFVATFAVDKAARKVASSGTEVTPKGTVALFGTTIIPGTNKILASDAAFGSVVLDLDNLAVPLAVTNITDNQATCWAIVSPHTGTGFLNDVIVSHLVEVDLTTGVILDDIPCDNQGQGMVDMRPVGGHIYALTPGNGTVPAAITVFDISGGSGTGKSIQNFAVAGADKNAEGMAVLLESHWWSW